MSDAAARGELIHSEDRSYRITHTTLNGMLRTLDDCTLVRLTFLVWKSASDRSWKEMVNRYVDETERALDALPEDGRRLIEKTTNDACRAMLDCTMATSLLLRALRIPIAILHPLRSLSKLNELNEHIRSLSRRLDQALGYASKLGRTQRVHIAYARHTNHEEDDATGGRSKWPHCRSRKATSSRSTTKNSWHD